MNPMQLLKMKGMLDRFQKDHPRFLPFLRDASGRVAEGTIIEISVKTASGETIRTNLKVNAEDVQMIRELGESAKAGQ